MPHDILVNVNFPDCRPDEVKGVEVTAQGRRRQERLHIDERKDGRGNPYYWIAYAPQPYVRAANGTDLAALDEKRVAITPLKLDMTDDPYRTRLALAELALRERRINWLFGRERRRAAGAPGPSAWNGFCKAGRC